MISTSQHADVLIVGAGPAGLGLAACLARSGLQVTVLEQQPEATVADPRPDGRDIALTHRSVGILQRLNQWDRIAPDQIAPIRRARVFNGTAAGIVPRFLSFDPPAATPGGPLGYLVPNHALRRAAWDQAREADRVLFRFGAEVKSVRGNEPGSPAIEATLADGQRLSAPLLIAADSRYSMTRRRLGIGAWTRDFGRTVIVCRMQHELPHEATASELFLHAGTLAILPMNGGEVSVVLTLRSDQAERWLEMAPAEFEAAVAERMEQRLGQLVLSGPRHAYPLVAVYAQRFCTHRAALLGDAAVGMHPVTAHGYNFGLYGIETLCGLVTPASGTSSNPSPRDIGDLALLQRYEMRHRAATLPIYLGTNALVSLYTDDRPPARWLRQGVLDAARHLPPLRDLIVRQLTDAEEPHRRLPFPRLPRLPDPLTWFKL
jgi:ubiquinone biosynthesis UbiH/UbiF/VisC/COQ6 family hydroxylase